MRAIFVAAAAAASVMAWCGLSAPPANAAMPVGVRPAVEALPVETVTNVCGNTGCVRVQTQRLTKHQKAGTAAQHH
jgi:hypothetical protein